MSATYPKIKDLAVSLVLLKRSELVATEKIHGANFRIMISGSARNIVFGAKGTLIRPGSFFEQFIEDVRAQIPLDKAADRLSGEHAWVLFGELFGPGIQKDILYLDKGVGIRFFDIMRNRKLVRYDEFRDMAERLSLPAVPELYRGPPDMEVFHQLTCEPSSLNSNSPREGIVIRDPLPELLDGQIPVAKFKNELFREKDYSVSYEDFMALADEEEKARLFAKNFVSEIRIRKMADILKEQGRLTRSPRDIPAIFSELLRDIQAEDTEYYKDLDKQIASRVIQQRVNRLFSGLLGKGKLDRSFLMITS